MVPGSLRLSPQCLFPSTATEEMNGGESQLGSVCPHWEEDQMKESVDFRSVVEVAV